MLWLILAEAAVELVPPGLLGNHDVLADARRKGVEPGRLLLDTNYHHSSMASLPGKEKRGRPDILHLCLLNAMKTPLNLAFKQLRVCVHVSHPDELIISMHPEMRVPRSRNRFDGLFSQLLHESRQDSGGTGTTSRDRAKGSDGMQLIDLKVMALSTFLERFDPANIHAFSVHASPDSYRGALEDAARLVRDHGDVAFVIGAFQDGQLASPTLLGIPPSRWHSISGIPLDAWTVVARVLYDVERVLGGG